MAAGQKPDSGATAAERVAFSTYVPVDVQRRLRVLAAQTGRKQHELVTEALEDYLRRHNG